MRSGISVTQIHTGNFMKLIMTPLVVLLGISQFATGSDVIPSAPQTAPIALIGGTIHPVSSASFDDGMVVFDKGRIIAVGKANDVAIPDAAVCIEIEGQHVYPGLFEAHSHLGLMEIAAGRATRDSRKTGSVKPNVRAHVSVNPDSELIPVTRSNGVLLALTSPQGGVISGQAAVMQLDGWTYEDMTLKPDAGLVVYWPGVPDGLKSDSKTDRVQEIRDLFVSARAYRKARETDETQRTDLKLEAMLPVIDGKLPMLVWANGLSTIQSAVAFAVEQDVRIIILGGYDADLCSELLKEHAVPVIVSGVYRLPRRRDAAFDEAYTLPERLRKAGVKFCISGTASSRSSNARNLPYHAGTAVAYGLPHDEALKAITLYPAEILGVAGRVGALQSGKDATLLVTTGDPLETTSNVVSAWIQGRTVDLDSRHKQLYRKYREKYRQLEVE